MLLYLHVNRHAVHPDLAVVNLNTMEFINAENYRDIIINLLKDENLPVDDLPATLSNFLVAIEVQEVIGLVGLEIYGSFALLR